MSRITSSGKTLLTLLLVGSAILAIGIFLDGKVISTPQPSAMDISSTAEDSHAAAQTPKPADSSQVAQQLKRAIDAANETEAQADARLEEKRVAAHDKIEEANRLLNEKGGSGQRVPSSERFQQFNQQHNQLKARLVELQASE